MDQLMTLCVHLTSSFRWPILRSSPSAILCAPGLLFTCSQTTESCIGIYIHFRTVCFARPHQLETVESRKSESKDQESIQSSTTPDPGYHMGKWQKHNYTSQTVPEGDTSSNKQTWKYEKHKTWTTKMIHKRRTALEQSVKIFYWRV